MAKQQYFN